MENLISTDNLIESAKKHGIDFGKGDPYNRLRYYTKIGWLPHMIRKSDDEGDIKGHYPDWALGHLILIEQLKAKDASNEEITKKLQFRNKIQGFVNLITSKEARTQITIYVILVLVVLILANQLELINLGKPKSQIVDKTGSSLEVPTQIIDSGTAFVPKNQNLVFVKSSLARTNMKVYVTFSQDYSPATRFWVSNINDMSGFTLELDAPASGNTEFNWWLSY